MVQEAVAVEDDRFYDGESVSQDDIVTLNVGGSLFTTRRHTCLKVVHSASFPWQTISTRRGDMTTNGIHGTEIYRHMYHPFVNCTRTRC